MHCVNTSSLHDGCDCCPSVRPSSMISNQLDLTGFIFTKDNRDAQIWDTRFYQFPMMTLDIC